MTMTIMVPGPLHPDLFGGMTPIMTPLKARAFKVRVKWSAQCSKCYAISSDDEWFTVVAADHEQAEEVAARRVLLEHSSACDMDFDAAEIFNPENVSAHDVEVSQKILGEINAKPTPTPFSRTR